jgi:Phosphoserine phosphatase RsbU, N-terminal domain
MTALDKLRLDYRVAFLRYNSRREEAALHAGYELGRFAVSHGVSILELAEVHHQAFLELLRDTDYDDVTGVVAAAAEFFLEALATYDMAGRQFLHREV